MELLTNEPFLTTVVGVIIAFVFGQTGILKTWFDYIFNAKKTKIEQENLEHKEREEELNSLRNQINDLKNVINKLEKDLTETTIYVKTLLSFLESNLPEGANPFIVEMAKEIRKKTV